jgi:branched-chain amino acid transport system substrate-binding protein
MNRAHAVALLAAPLAASPIAALAQAKGAPYKIGVTYPLSGPLAPVANEYFKGAEVAIDDLNRAGGVKGHPLQLAVEDSQGTPQGGVAAMRKLAQVDGVQAILTVFTNVVTAQIPLADQLKIPTMSTVESPGLFAHSKYSFSHAPTWGTTLPLLVTYWKGHGVKRVFGTLTNTGIGQLQTAAIRSALNGTGIEYMDGLLDPDATDFRGTIARARDFKADALVFTGQGSTVESIAIKQTREMGFNVSLFSMGQNYSNKVFGDSLGVYAEGMVFAGLYMDPKTTPKFTAAYKAKMGYEPSYIAGEVYDIIHIFANAIEHGGYNGEAMLPFITNLKGLPSVIGGTITMGPEHYTEFTAEGLFVVNDGKLHKIASAKH